MKRRQFTETMVGAVGASLIPVGFVFSRTETGRLNGKVENNSNVSKEDSAEVLLIPMDEMNKNKRIYPKDTLEKALEDFKKEQFEARHTEELTGGFYPSGDLGGIYDSFNLSDAAFGVSKLHVYKDQGLRGTIRYLQTEKGKQLNHAMNYGMDLVYRMVGTGKIWPDGHITDYNFAYVSCFPRKDCSWEGDWDARE